MDDTSTLLFGSVFCLFFLFIWSLNPFLRSVFRSLFWILLERIFGHSKDFPRLGAHAVEDVSNPTWLTKMLCIKNPKTKVKSAKAKSMGSDMGNASTMFRIEIDYEENPSNLPTVMICKLVKNDLSNRIPFTATRMNEMECRFYSSTLCDELINLHHLHFPQGFAGKYNLRTGNSVILLSDITSQGGTFTTEQTPIQTLNQGKEILQTLANFHGSFLNSHSRFNSDLKWIIKQNDPLLCMTSEFFKAGWKSFLLRLGPRLPEEVKSRGILLAPVAQQLHDYFGRGHQTLVHGDCHLENSYFTKDGKLGLYDLQLFRIGHFAIDLASFIGGSFHLDMKRNGLFHSQREDELLLYYYTCLKQKVNDDERFGQYSIEELKHDYKLALALLFVWNVAACLAVPFDTSASDDYDEYAIRLISSLHRTSAINCALWEFSVAPTPHLRGKPIVLNKWTLVPNIHRCLTGECTHVPFGVKLQVTKTTSETPKSWLDQFLYRRLKYELIYRKTSSKKGHHGQNTNEISFQELESHHSVTYAKGTPMEKFAFDSYYVSSFSKETSFALRWCRRFEQDQGEVWLVLKVNETTWTWIDHPNTKVKCYELDENTICVENSFAKMTLTLLEPMKRWKVVFKGKLKELNSSINVQDFLFELETESCIAFATHVDPSLVAKCLSIETFSKPLFDELKATHQEHYEQFCYVKGWIQQEQGGKRILVDGKGMRDRAFGCREWGYMARYFASYLVCDNGFVISWAFASLPTMTSGKFGMVCGFQHQDSFSSIDGMSSSLNEMAPNGDPPLEWELAFHTNNGFHFKVRCFVDGESIGLNMGPNGMWVHLRFAHYHVRYFDPTTNEFKETNGIGASEFGYRFDGYKPYRPTTPVFDPVFASGANKH